MTAVVEVVLGIPDGEKCLIFSQWDEMLSIVGAALLQNGVRWAKLKGQVKLERELANFRSDPAVRALLLPLRSGANGINLVEATHVLLLEPLLNSAVEAQAVGRVHRISQTKATTVHRFVVRGTIEEAIHSMQLQERDGGAAATGGCSEVGSPARRAARTEEAKALSWEQVQALFVEQDVDQREAPHH